MASLLMIWCAMSLALNISDLDKLSDPNDIINQRFQENPAAPIALIWINLCVSFLTFVSSVVVIVGIWKDNANLLIPWMLMVLLLVILDASSIIFNIVYAGFSKLLIVFLLLWIITTLINIYCELCVFSHFQELRSGRGRPEDYGVRNGTLYKDEIPGNTNGQPNGGTALSNGRVFELRPVTSLPAEMNMRYTGNSYTGSIEMKIVDSMPVIVDGKSMVNANNYTGSLDMTNGNRPERGRRFRTVSESAVRQPMIDEISVHASTNSLNDTSKPTKTKESKRDNSSSSGTPRTATFVLGNKDTEVSLLSKHSEEDEMEES